MKKEIARLATSARRSAEWSKSAEKGKFGNGPVDRGFIGHKAARMMQRAKSVEARRGKAVEEKSRLLHNLEHEAPLSIRPCAFHSKHLLECSGLSVDYGDRAVLRDVSFSLMSGERLALTGQERQRQIHGVEAPGPAQAVVSRRLVSARFLEDLVCAAGRPG